MQTQVKLKYTHDHHVVQSVRMSSNGSVLDFRLRLFYLSLLKRVCGCHGGWVRWCESPESDHDYHHGEEANNQGQRDWHCHNTERTRTRAASW
jgi:hypothetical protein